jgi:hypothetical protein
MRPSRSRAEALYEEFLVRELSLVVADQSGRVHRARGSGLHPLMTCLRTQPSVLEGALVFDKIVGAAAALLLALGRVRELWTPVASSAALGVLARHRIPFRAQKLVSYIPNAAGDGPCPFESMAYRKTPAEFYEHLVRVGGHPNHRG